MKGNEQLTERPSLPRPVGVAPARPACFGDNMPNNWYLFRRAAVSAARAFIGCFGGVERGHGAHNQTILLMCRLGKTIPIGTRASGASTIIGAVETTGITGLWMVDRPGAACIGDVNDYCSNRSPADWRCARYPRQGADDRGRWLQSLACPAGRALHSSVHRHGLWLFRVLAAAVACDRTDSAEGVSRHYACPGTVHDDLRLESREHGLDVHAVVRRARRLCGPLGRLARTPGRARTVSSRHCAGPAV
jgi:hypothetical protein